MNKTEFLKVASSFLLLAILFTPLNSNFWVYFLVPGTVFGILWFNKI
ncbi:MAG: hypothetical protein ABIH59_01420 [archaeon]